MPATRSAIISVFIIFCIFSLALITLYLNFGSKECHEGSFLCVKSKVCIANKYKCNKNRDCFYGEDENNLTCANLYALSSYNNVVSPGKPKVYNECALRGYPTQCQCKAEVSLNCNHLGLTRVPKNVSNNLKKIALMNNSIVLYNDSFDGYNSLKMIHLQFNNLTRVPPFVFKNQNKLKWLFLLNNNLKILEKDAFYGLNNIANMFLDNNSLEYLNVRSWKHMTQLKWLELGCNLLTFKDEYFPNLTELQILNISWNRIEKINGELLANLPKLLNLDLSNNMIVAIDEKAFHSSKNLSNLKLNNNKITTVTPTMFSHKESLIQLSLGHNPISLIYANIFSKMKNLNSLELNGINKENIDMTLFDGLEKLETLYFKEFHYCVLYARKVNICYPNTDGLSSSLNLLPQPILRKILWLVAVFTLLMNALVFYGRMFSTVGDENKAINFVIRNLAVADMLMSVYLMVIGYHDTIYTNEYYLYDQEWKFSNLCTIIGIIAVVSSEVSLLILVFLSLERFLLIAVPLSGYHVLKLKTAVYCMVSIWLVGIIISIAPLFLWKYSSHFYSSNGLCYPLYIEDPFVIGWQYSAFMFLGLHSTSLLLMSILYALMFISIWKTRQAARIPVDDLNFAVRFFFIVLANVFCWLPIIILKIAALRKFHISSEMYGWVIVFVVPINALVNPLLYTFTTPKYRNILTSKNIFKIPKRDSNSGVENSQTSYLFSLYSRNFKKNTKPNTQENTFEITNGEDNL